MENPNVITIAVTGAVGMVGSNLCTMIATGRMFGETQKVRLQLLELPVALKALGGMIEELQDCICPVLDSVIGTSDPEEAFKNADCCLLVGARPRGPGMTRADLITCNAGIFKGQAEAIGKFAKPDTKICVVGNPANINAAIISQYAPNIPKRNISCLMRLDENRLIGKVRKYVSTMKVDPRNIVNGIIWGNHSQSMGVDIKNMKINGADFADHCDDAEWIESLEGKVANRGAEIIELKGSSSSVSAAMALCDHMHDWFYGTKEGQWVSMGVFPIGNKYGIPEDIVFSIPCKISKNGEWECVNGLELDDRMKNKIIDNVKEIQEQVKMANDGLKA